MIVLFPALIVLSAPGCGLLGTGSDETTVEVGTVRVIAFDHFGVPASRADVVVHDSHGEVFARAKLADDGTGEVTSVAGGTVSVAMFTDSDDLSLAKRRGGVPDLGSKTRDNGVDLPSHPHHDGAGTVTRGRRTIGTLVERHVEHRLGLFDDRETVCILRNAYN